MPQFAIVPNPVLSNATIQMNSNCLGANLVIYDILGNKVNNIENISKLNINLNAGDYSEGIYFIVINKGEHAVKRKIFFK